MAFTWQMEYSKWSYVKLSPVSSSCLDPGCFIHGKVHSCLDIQWLLRGMSDFINVHISGSGYYCTVLKFGYDVDNIQEKFEILSFHQ